MEKQIRCSNEKDSQTDSRRKRRYVCVWGCKKMEGGNKNYTKILTTNLIKVKYEKGNREF